MKSHISGIQIPTASRINIDGGLTLDAQAGNSGEMMISQGTGNTPIWSNTLTSPTITTSLLTGSTSFNLLTTTATTINFGLAATTMNIATNNVAKTINIGTGASGGNQTDINIGTSASATTSNINLYGQTLLGKPVTSATTASGFGTTLTTQGTSGTGTTGNATGADLYIYSGGANLTNASNLAGVATSGNLILDVGSAAVAYFDGTTAYGNIQIGTGNASAITIGRSGLTTTIGGNVTATQVFSTSNGSGTNFKVGDDAWIGDINLANTISVRGQQNPANGYIAFGDANGTALGRASTGPLTYGAEKVRSAQIVYAIANSGAATTTTVVSPFAAANDVLSSLEAGVAYRFSGTYYFTSTFTSGTPTIQLAFAFSNAPVIFKYNFKTYNSSGLGATFSLVGLSSTNGASTVSASITNTSSYVVEFEGFFTSNATTGGSITPQFRMSTTGVSTVATAGSFFEIERLRTSSETLIAGNWA